MNRYRILKELIRSQKVRKAIVFTRTRRGAYRLSKRLKKNGYNAKAYHGDLSQNQRDKVTRRFRKNRLDFLVATNIAARGLDIDGITHIINYNMPQQPAAYFHRIGRTARMEKEGTAISLVAYDDFDTLDDIRDETSTQITELKTSIEVKKGPPKKYKAVCSKCNAKTELPFKPTQGRPVYCQKCYRSQRRRHRRRH